MDPIAAEAARRPPPLHESLPPESGTGGSRGRRLQTHAGVNRHRQLGDDLAGVRGHHRRAHKYVGALLNVQPDEAASLTVQDGAAHPGQFDCRGFQRDSAVPSLFLGQADVGDFRVGERAPGDREGACRCLTVGQSVPHRDPGQFLGDVRQVVARRDRVDVLVTGPKIFVDGDARPPVESDARLLQA